MRRLNNIIQSACASPDEVTMLEEAEKQVRPKDVSSKAALKRRILLLGASDRVKSVLLGMYNRMDSMMVDSQEYTHLFDKLRWAVSLPYTKCVMPEISLKGAADADIAAFCQHVHTELDAALYGMQHVKEHILQIINNRIRNGSNRSIMALKGAPGVGKTAIAKAMAAAMNLPFDKISFGGMTDASMIKGSDSHWLGSAPSIILQMLSRMQCANGIILFDELDKTNNTSRGVEIQHALLHILDHTQNNEFQDSYLSEIPHDLSNVWFMVAFNDDTFDPALRDRLDIIEIPAYTRSERATIAIDYVMPHMLKELGLGPQDVTLPLDAAKTLVNNLSDVEKCGMRDVQRAIYAMLSKA